MVDIGHARLAEVGMFHLSDHEAIHLCRLHSILLTPLVIKCIFLKFFLNCHVDWVLIE